MQLGFPPGLDGMELISHRRICRGVSSASGWEHQEPPPEAYGRVTDAERFRPLHSAMLEILGRLEEDFDVERVEGYGLDEELESRVGLARASVRLSPVDADAAPITVAFSDFPGLRVRFGRWNIEPFPDCGCDACGGVAEEEIEQLTEMVDCVTAGGFREAVQRPLAPSIGRHGRYSPLSPSPRAVQRLLAPFIAPFIGIGWLIGDGWLEREFRSSVLRRSGRSRIDGTLARRMSGGRRRLELDWKPWPRREAPTSIDQ